MNEIAKQLRERAGTCAVVIDPAPSRQRDGILDAAADEIDRLAAYAEQLKGALAELKGQADLSLDHRNSFRAAIARARAVLGKNPNPSGQETTEASVHRTAEASGPVGLGPERYCKYCELPIEDIGDEERCPLKPDELTQTSSPICTCGSDVVPGPFHHPTCPSREPHEGNEERKEP